MTVVTILNQDGANGLFKVVRGFRLRSKSASTQQAGNLTPENDTHIQTCSRLGGKYVQRQGAGEFSRIELNSGYKRIQNLRKSSDLICFQLRISIML
ncbi:hypothetical protein Enr17x_41700 [Gimesia fumaroli]|uniref:Uncharacterized protein n=1 Tax=Gimesia fumaroli TaxID=2527976 RepID=A0A518IG97_9PLAN|nr:hypothetical protein Enr17x_41700 [Gimesia fumaroli]